MKEVLERYDNAGLTWKKLFEKLDGDHLEEGLDIALASVVKELKDLTQMDPVALAAHVLRQEKIVYDENLWLLAFDSAFLSLLLGFQMDLNEEQLQHIVQACLLRDLGMTRVPPYILNKKESLLDHEVNEIRKHPRHSCEILQEKAFVSSRVIRIIAQHHENYDGSGYPEGLTGQRIDKEARIIAVVDGFFAMLRLRPHKDPSDGFKVMKEILNQGGKKYDPDVVGAFIKTLGVFPPGTWVMLNNKSLAVVEEVYAGNPLNPLVRLCIDEKGQTLEEDSSCSIDLREENLFIVKAVNIHEIQQ